MTTPHRPSEPLPIDDALEEIVARARESGTLVLTASPGAGKTTRVPPALLSILTPSTPKLLLLEPRRIAARAAAARIAEENEWTLGGDEVGYQVRFENRVTSRTRLQVLTEGLLARRMCEDPELTGTGCVVLDEFHERSWHVDLALGLLYELKQTSRPDLIIVVMSATLDADRVAAFLGDAPIVHVPGTAHPVNVEYARTPQLLQTGREFTERVAATLRGLIEGAQPRERDVLAFLPGAGEIARVSQAIATTASARGFDVHSLHGNLPLDLQTRAIRKGERPKIVLATNVAETSVTVDGVGTVVDSGLARSMHQEPYGFPRLELGRISRFSAIQRMGRAGRQGPGRGYRLWTALDERAMADAEAPEILRNDISEALLALAAQGISRPEGFSWLDSPSSAQFESARASLRSLGAIDAEGTATAEGRTLLRLPLEPRIGKIALEGARRGSLSLASALAAVLSEKDLFLRGDDARNAPCGESDPLARLWLLEDRGAQPPGGVDRGALERARRTRDQIASAIRAVTRPASSPTALDDETETRALLLSAFADRLARRRRPGQPDALLVGGRGAKLSPRSACERSELFVCARAIEIERGPGRPELVIEWASPVDRAEIAKRFPDRVAVSTWTAWDPETEQALGFSAQRYLDLPLEEPKPAKPSREAARPLLVEAVLAKWDSLLARNEEGAQTDARLRFAARAVPELTLPALDSEFRRIVAHRLAKGETRLSAIESKNWSEALLADLSWDAQTALDREVPARFLAPSGSRVAIHYPEGQVPFVEIRIQEVFGLAATPAIGRGRIPLQLRLLAPNYRPFQVTQDLASFWRNGYAEARKELRARYPKHAWPDDPIAAAPQAKGRPTRSR